MRLTKAGQSIAVVLFVTASVACSDPSPAATSGCPQSAQVFWQKFRAAVVSGDLNAVAEMTRFPLEIQNDMDHNYKKTVSRQEFVQRFTRLLNIEELDDPSPTPTAPASLLSMKKVVDTTVKLHASLCSSSGRQFSVGNWTFLLDQEGWRFVIAHSNEF